MSRQPTPDSRPRPSYSAKAVHVDRLPGLDVSIYDVENSVREFLGARNIPVSNRKSLVGLLFRVQPLVIRREFAFLREINERCDSRVNELLEFGRRFSIKVCAWAFASEQFAPAPPNSLLLSVPVT